MKVTAIAPANIAFIKYWGKTDDALRLPLNSSISMNLSACVTTTTVEFSPSYREDIVEFMDQKALTILSRSLQDCQLENMRIQKHLDKIRVRAGSKLYARMVTKNSFPKSAGIASSASGYAALTVAAAEALGLTLSEKELTILARLGSGSACRSIPDGFVEWKKGIDSDSSYAYSLYPHTYWDLRDVLAIVDFRMKKVSTTEGQTGVKTSPFWRDRVARIPGKMTKTKAAINAKKFRELGEIIEEDCLNMHHIMQTQKPSLFYWNNATKTIMEAVVGWRKQGLPVYFSIDAGPNVHLICEAKDEEAVVQKVREIVGIESIIINKPSRGARTVTEHLF